jgi:hypothetical protein
MEVHDLFVEVRAPRAHDDFLSIVSVAGADHRKRVADSDRESWRLWTAKGPTSCSGMIRRITDWQRGSSR